MVAIEVGTDDKVKRFLIHKQLLCDRMEYFNKMFNGQFKEGIEQKGSFPEDDIEAWGLMVEWVYRDISAAMPFASKSREEKKATILSLYKAVGLAEKYVIWKLQISSWTTSSPIFGTMAHSLVPSILTWPTLMRNLGRS